jgi:hypothetical protein
MNRTKWIGDGSLSRLEIPASVKSIGLSAFFGYSRLNEVLFEANSQLRRIDGFQGCASLIQIDIPASVEFVESRVFSGCASVQELRMSPGTRIRAVGRSVGFRAFVVYEDDNDVKLRRRQLHLSTVGLRVSKPGHKYRVNSINSIK